MVEKKRAGRKAKIDPVKVAWWRRLNKASIAKTAEHFGISSRSVAKACSEQAEAVRAWKEDQEELSWQRLEAEAEWLTMKMRRLHEASEQADAARDAYKKGEGPWSDCLDASAEVHFWAKSLGAFDEGRDRLWR